MDPLGLMKFSYEKKTPNKRVFQSHASYEIFYFHCGRGNYLIGDKIYVMSPGDLIIMHGMTLHCSNPKLDGEFSYVRSVIDFDPTPIRSIQSQLFTCNVLEPFERLGNCKLNLKEEDKEQFEAILGRMNEFYGKKEIVSINRLRLAFADLLIYVYGLFQNPIVHQIDHLSEKERHVQEMITFIEHNYMKDLHMDHLEKVLYVNKYYLSRIFREVTGVTIFHYLYERRINQAKIIFLLEPKKTVTELCYELGFKHATHFCRVFKKLVGFTPDQYRKRINNKYADPVGTSPHFEVR